MVLGMKQDHVYKDLDAVCIEREQIKNAVDIYIHMLCHITPLYSIYIYLLLLLLPNFTT